MKDKNGPFFVIQVQSRGGPPSVLRSWVGRGSGLSICGFTHAQIYKAKSGVINKLKYLRNLHPEYVFTVYLLNLGESIDI